MSYASRVKPGRSRVAARTASVIIAGLAIFNTAFWFLSALYMKDRGAEAANIMIVRGAFATLTGVLAIATFLTSLAPRHVGHGLAVLLGFMALTSAVEALAHDMPPVLFMTLLIAGLLFPLLAYMSWRGSRVAWSYLIAMAVVFGLVTFFGAPKVRAQLGTSLWYALIVPALYFTTVSALTMVRDTYRRA
jgi:hypothetical protein